MTRTGTIPFAAGLAIALAAGWVAFPRALYSSRPQPVNFSHKIHADKAGAKCSDCHSFREDGSFAGLPTLDQCAGCHGAPMGTSVAEKNFIDQYVTPNRAPQWFAHSRQPENVFFSHAVHVTRAKLACDGCHGAEGSSETTRAYQADRISGYSRDVWKGMKMADCIACHRTKGLEHSCLDCHK